MILMSIFVKFKKKKAASSPTPPVSDTTLAGIPAQDVEWNSGNDQTPPLNNIGSDQDAFIYPPPADGGWTQTYALVFFLMENNVCTRKIEYNCYGYEYPDDIVERMMRDGVLSRKPSTSYRILYWPTRNGMSTVDQFDNSAPRQLQDFNPHPGKVLIIEQYRKIPDPIPMHTLYGCPTAALPEQESALNNTCVDVLSFD